MQTVTPHGATEREQWRGRKTCERRVCKRIGFKCATLKAKVRIILLRCERKQSLSGDPLQIDLSLICSSGLLFELNSTPAGTPQLGEWGNLLGSVNGPGTYFGDQSPNLLGNCPNLEQVRNNVYIRFASHDRNHCY